MHMEIYWYAIHHVLSYLFYITGTSEIPLLYAPIYSFLNSSDYYLDRDSLYSNISLNLYNGEINLKSNTFAHC